VVAKFPVVAIVGRTNVGKSTLFNAITGQRVNIVEDAPGITRDRSYQLIKHLDFPFTLIDTGGLFSEDEEKIKDLVEVQTDIAISEADVILVLFDALSGPHPDDYLIVDKLRKSQKQVFWVINKCEKESSKLNSSEFYGLGIEEFDCISAAHNRGIKEVLARIRDYLKEQNKLVALQDEEEEENILKVAIVGKPNVGKSTLVNRILGEERVVASDTPGTTRDTVDIRLTREGQEYLLIDTAGLRRKARIENVSVERYSAIRSINVLSRADVAIFLLDATEGPPTEQDAKIGSLIQERGRSLVLVVNKWDAIEKDHKSVKEYEKGIQDKLGFLHYAPILFVSALTGKRCPSILSKAKQVHENSMRRVATSELNKTLKKIFERKPPPVYRGEPLKLFFGTQIGTSPPVFVLFLNHPRKLAASYQRYIKNSLRKEFPFEGVDFKLILRKKTSKQNELNAEG